MAFWDDPAPPGFQYSDLVGLPSLPEMDHARADRFMEMLDALQQQRTDPNAPQGFLDRFALGLAANPLPQTTPRTPLEGFATGLLGGASRGFAQNRIRSRGLDKPDLSGRMDMLKLVGMAANQEQAGNNQKLGRAIQLAGLNQKLKAASEPEKPKGFTVADLNKLNLPISYLGKTVADLTPEQLRKVPKSDLQAMAELDPGVAQWLAGLANTTGTIAGFPLGRNPVQSVNMIGRAAIAQNGGTPSDLGMARADFGANSAAYRKLVQQRTAVGAFKKSVSANAQMLRGLIGKIPETGNKWTNAPLRDLASSTGSVDMAAFDAVLKSVANEYSKIITNPNLTGVLTDEAQKAGAKLLDRRATGPQLLAALDVLERESNNRDAGFAQEIEHLRDAISPQKSSVDPSEVERARAFLRKR